MSKKHFFYQAIILCLCLMPVSGHAMPVVSDGYSIELYAEGLGAVTGLTIGNDGSLYAADYAGGRIVQISGQNILNTYASGIIRGNRSKWISNNRVICDAYKRQ